MQIRPPDENRSFYARLAGLMYLLNYITSVFGEIAPTVMLSFATLWFYTAAPALNSFQPMQLQSLVAVTQKAAGNGFQIAMMFLAVGSTIFFYLFYKSAVFPKAFAAFSVFASVVLFIVSAGILLFPQYQTTLNDRMGSDGCG